MGQVIMNGERRAQSWHTFRLQIFSVSAKNGSNPFKTRVFVAAFIGI